MRRRQVSNGSYETSGEHGCNSWMPTGHTHIYSKVELYLQDPIWSHRGPVAGPRHVAPFVLLTDTR